MLLFILNGVNAGTTLLGEQRHTFLLLHFLMTQTEEKISDKLNLIIQNF